MPGVWLSGLIAIALAAADEAAPEPEAEADEEVTPAAVAPDERPLPAAPAGRPLAQSGPILLQRAERPDGTALERIIEPSGEVVLHVVNRAGTVLSCDTVGALHAMRVVEQRDASGGEVIQVVRDASGALLRYVVAADGEPRAVTVLVAPR